MSEAHEFKKLTDMFFPLVNCWKNDGDPDRFALKAYRVGNYEVQTQVKQFASARSISDGGELLAEIVRIDIEKERKFESTDIVEDMIDEELTREYDPPF